MADDFARELRRNPTEAERKLWFHLRRRALQGHRFRRQHPVPPYVVDFICLERRLIVELDGDQHGWDANKADERRRTEFLESQNFRLLRFWNREIFQDIENVVESIRLALVEE